MSKTPNNYNFSNNYSQYQYNPNYNREENNYQESQHQQYQRSTPLNNYDDNITPNKQYYQQENNQNNYGNLTPNSYTPQVRNNLNELHNNSNNYVYTPNNNNINMTKDDNLNYINNNSNQIKDIENFNRNNYNISNNTALIENNNTNKNYSQSSLSLRLDHAMGYNGTVPKSTIIHPNLINYVYIAGSVIVIAEMNDASSQIFLRGHDDEVTSIALSHSGNLLASGQKGKNSDLIIWDFNSKEILFRLAEHDFRVEILQFSQDDKLLYSSGNVEDKKQFIWDTSNGYIVTNCLTHPVKTVAMAWGYKIRDNRGNTTDCYQFATCGGFALALWSLDPFKGTMDYEQVQTGNFSREYISLAYSLNDQKFLYAGTTSGDVVCFLIKNKMIVFSKIICAKGITSIIPLSKNQVLVGGGDGTLSLNYIEEPKCETLAQVELFGAIYSLSPSEDGVQLLAATDKGFIYRVRAADLSYILLNENHTDGVIKMDFLRNANALPMNYNYSNNTDKYQNHYLNNTSGQSSVLTTKFGTTSLDGTIRLWDLNDYSVYFRLFLNPSLTPVCLFFTDECLFSGWSDGKLRTYQISNSKELWSIDNVHKNGVSALTVAKNNKFLCTGGENGEVRVWEIRSLEMVSNLKEHKSKVTKMQLMENDLHLLTTAKDRSILIWDLTKEQRISNYQMGMGGVNNFATNPQDPNMLITVGQDRKITQWDFRQPKPVKIISSNPFNRSEFADELFSIAISNDGRYMATGGTSGILRCYDLPNMGFLCEQPAHSETVTDIFFTSDVKHLVSAGSDSQILTYELNI